MKCKIIADGYVLFKERVKELWTWKDEKEGKDPSLCERSPESTEIILRRQLKKADQQLTVCQLDHNKVTVELTTTAIEKMTTEVLS